MYRRQVLQCNHFFAQSICRKCGVFRRNEHSIGIKSNHYVIESGINPRKIYRNLVKKSQKFKRVFQYQQPKSLVVRDFLAKQCRKQLFNSQILATSMYMYQNLETDFNQQNREECAYACFRLARNNYHQQKKLVLDKPNFVRQQKIPELNLEIFQQCIDSIQIPSFLNFLDIFLCLGITFTDQLPDQANINEKVIEIENFARNLACQSIENGLFLYQKPEDLAICIYKQARSLLLKNCNQNHLQFLVKNEKWNSVSIVCTAKWKQNVQKTIKRQIKQSIVEQITTQKVFSSLKSNILNTSLNFHKTQNVSHLFKRNLGTMNFRLLEKFKLQQISDQSLVSSSQQQQCILSSITNTLSDRQLNFKTQARKRLQIHQSFQIKNSQITNENNVSYLKLKQIQMIAIID